MHPIAEYVISDFRFLLWTEHPYTLVSTNRHLEGFRPSLPPASDAYEIQVQILLSHEPSHADHALLFDSESSWSLWSHTGMGRFVFKTLQNPQRWLYTAEMPLDTLPDQIKIYANPRVVRTPEQSNQIQNPFVYPLDQILLMHALPWIPGIIIHAACLVRKGRAFVFAGRSGAGKSTLARLMQSTRGFEVINDDRVIIRAHKDRVYVHATPWPGEASIAKPGRWPLGGIFLINKSKQSGFINISERNAVLGLLPFISIPWYLSDVTQKQLQFIQDLISIHPVLQFNFALDPKVKAHIKNQIESRLFSG